MKIDNAKIRITSNEFNSNTSVSKRVSVFSDDKRYEVAYLSIDQLKPYNKQTRKLFSEEEIEQLAVTIKEHGIRQPLTVLRSSSDELVFEVISGERRLRAAKLVGLLKIPCIIVEDLAKAEEIALIENVQRQDLHPMEIARALKSLIDRVGWGGQTELKSKVGLSNSQISELIKLNTLHPDVQNLILETDFRGRENLRKLFNISSQDEQADFIKGMSGNASFKKIKKTFSVLRLAFNENELKIQKKSLSKLTLQQKIVIKDNLNKLIDEIDESLDGSI
ncbi:MAG: ParB/RepB/Spo0J family partition protein [Alphaproteobacteria bacterium]|nr:ParB/RepB/Spo0J family partition protein [Alphaproteobacteria bacterium]